MTTKNPPAVVILTMIFLMLTAIIGTINVSTDIGRWRVLGMDIVPVWAICKAVFLAVVPSLALIDLLFRRPSGKYLALVPMLWVLGLCLKPFASSLAALDLPKSQLSWMFFTLSFVATYSLGSAILTLGFSRKVNEYLHPNAPNHERTT